MFIHELLSVDIPWGEKWVATDSADLSLKNPVLNRKRTINSPAKNAAGSQSFDFLKNVISFLFTKEERQMQWVLAQQSLCLGLTITIFGLSLVGHNRE
jgi:hypothetical protein